MNKYVINYVYNVEGQVLAACAFDKHGNYGVSTISPDDRPDKAVAKYLALARMCMRQNTVKQFKDFWVTVDREETHVSRIRGDVKFSALVEEMVLFTQERAGKYFKADTDNEKQVYGFFGHKNQKDVSPISTTSEFDRLFGVPVRTAPQWMGESVLITNAENTKDNGVYATPDLKKKLTFFSVNDTVVGKGHGGDVHQGYDGQEVLTPEFKEGFREFWAAFEAQYKEKYDDNEKRGTDPKPK